MYVFEFMDGTWRIDRQTNSKIKFADILKNKKAFALYDGIYYTESQAYVARKEIEDLLKKDRFDVV